MPAHDPHSPAQPPPSKTRRRRRWPLAWFLIKLVIVFFILVWPWHLIAAGHQAVWSVRDWLSDAGKGPTFSSSRALAELRVNAAYSQAFAAACNWCIGRLRWGSEVTHEGQPLQGILGSTGFALLVSEYSKPPEKRSDLALDIEIGVINFKHGRRPGWEYRARTDSRMTGYVPTATFLTLALATPMPLRRRLWSLPAGLLAVQAFIALRVALALASYCNGPEPYCLYHLGPTSSKYLALAFQIICAVPAMTYLVPLTVWMALCLRKDSVLAVTGRARNGA